MTDATAPASSDLHWLDATAQAELVRSGAASPLELVDHAIGRIEALNPTLNSVIHERFEMARAQARAGDLPDGPFRGVPILFKDLMCAVEGDPYHEGMQALKDAGHRAKHTDHLARAYLDAGFAYLGRTNTPELGLVPTTEPLAYGPTHNPWALGHTTGGSSGGSAAAVAAGLVPVAHANDGGGSIRIPAAACGLVGLKPSRGRTSLGPNKGEFSAFLIVELCVTRTVRDTAAVLDAVTGRRAGDPVTAPTPRRPFAHEVGADPGRLRIGFATHHPLLGTPLHPDVVAATEETARLLESLGHHVEAAHPAALDDVSVLDQFTTAWAVGCAYDARHLLAEVGLEPRADLVEPLTWALAEGGFAIDALSMLEAVAAGEAYSRRVESWWVDEGWDLLLTPTLGEPPVPHGTFDPTPEDPTAGFVRSTSFVPWTAQFNVTGQPAISVPIAENAQGLPIGVQLVGAYGREDLLLQVAAQLETAKPWAGRRPTIA
ncbi:MAG: 6-aminohexanoate-cyclic-dimer hydrolase [Gemmatimonadota bacterium]